MPAEERCERTELPVSMCAHCRHSTSIEDEVHAEQAEFIGKPGWIAAQYGGRCAGCGSDIHVGDMISSQSVTADLGWIGICCAKKGEG